MKRRRRGPRSAPAVSPTLAESSQSYRRRIHRGPADAISLLMKMVRLLIAVAAWILPLWFAWLQVKNYPILVTIKTIQPYVILQVLLIVYYFCWVAGTRFDVTTQESIYLADYSFPWTQFGSGIALIAAGAALLWSSNDDKKFAIMLSIFVAVNVVFWAILRLTVSTLIRGTRTKYAEMKDYYGLAQLDVVEEYILGNWQWKRFLGMGLIVLAGDAISFLDGLRSSISVALQPMFGGLKPQEISPLLPQVGFLVFLIFAEGWIWLKRAVTRATMYALNRLAAEYKLEPK